MQIDVKNLSQGKNKGLLTHNNQHGMNSLIKHTSNEDPKLYKKWGLFFLQIMVETNEK